MYENPRIEVWSRAVLGTSRFATTGTSTIRESLLSFERCSTEFIRTAVSPSVFRGFGPSGRRPGRARSHSPPRLYARSRDSDGRWIDVGRGAHRLVCDRPSSHRIVHVCPVGRDSVGSGLGHNSLRNVETDALTIRTPFSSESGALVRTGPSATFLRHATVLPVVFSLLVVPLVVSTVGLSTASVGILLVVLGWGLVNSLPPVALVRRGLGEMVNALLGGLLLPLYGGSTVEPPTLAAALAVIPFTLVVGCNLLAIHWADREADRTVGKRTLAVDAAQSPPTSLRCPRRRRRSRHLGVVSSRCRSDTRRTGASHIRSVSRLGPADANLSALSAPVGTRDGHPCNGVDYRLMGCRDRIFRGLLTLGGGFENRMTETNAADQNRNSLSEYDSGLF